jgi:GTP-binding protein
MSNLANRKGILTNMEKLPHTTMIEAHITTRGLIGMEIDVVNATSGRGVLSHLFKEYAPYAGEVLTRITGTIIATEAGTTTGYALEMVQERGTPQRGHLLQCGSREAAHQLPLPGFGGGHRPHAGDQAVA